MEIDLVAAGRAGLLVAGLLRFEGLAAQVEAGDFGDGIDEPVKAGVGGSGLGQFEGGFVQESEDERLGALEMAGAGLGTGFVDEIGELIDGAGEVHGFEGTAHADQGGGADVPAKPLRRGLGGKVDDVRDGDLGSEPFHKLALLRGGELIEHLAALGAAVVVGGAGGAEAGTGAGATGEGVPGMEGAAGTGLAEAVGAPGSGWEKGWLEVINVKRVDS